jgi:MFS family permease
VAEARAAGRAGERWLTPGVTSIGVASFLDDLGHEVPTALLPSLLTSTLGAPAAALGVIEGISDGLSGASRLAGGALADDPQRRRATAVGGYAATAVLSSAIGAATTVWQVGVLRAGAWTVRGLRSPARNALLADVVPVSAYGRAYGFERAMDNLGAIGGPLLALALVAAFSVRTAILLSVVPGLLAVIAIVAAVRAAPALEERERRPLRVRVRPVLQGRLGRLLIGVSAFEVGNVAATLLILRATELLEPERGHDGAVQTALLLYVAYNVAATAASAWGGRVTDRRGAWSFWPAAWRPSSSPTQGSRSPTRVSWSSRSSSSQQASESGASRRRSTPRLRRSRKASEGRRSDCWPRPRAWATLPRAWSRAFSGRPCRRASRSSTSPAGCLLQSPY